MKVLSLAWKYHPSITSGVGVACEGLNNALSKIVDLTVIYPKVTSIRVEEEVLLSNKDLTTTQRRQIEKEYIELIKDGEFEVAVRLDPYFVSKQKKYNEKFQRTVVTRTEESKEEVVRKIKLKKFKEKLIFDEVDIFGEFVRDKIFVYNRLVEELASGVQFDIIHAHDWMTFLAGIALKDKYNKPLVLHVHSLEYDRVGHKDASWVYEIERFAMSKANKVITTSNYTKGIIESNYGLSQNHISTIPNAITFPPSNEYVSDANQNGSFKVLFAGRIDGNKGIEYFINIAQHVLKKDRSVDFIVVGRGNGDVRFNEVEGFDSIKANFHYLGFVERDKLFELYATCDMLCMPSISEPFGLTAIEAAYMGLPVVLSNKTGASEILKRTPKADFWDISKFSAHILSIKNDPKLKNRIISNNKKDISRLSWEDSASKILDLFNGVINNFYS